MDVQENCLEYFRKTNTIFRMFSYKSLASGAFILESIVIADNKLMDL